MGVVFSSFSGLTSVLFPSILKRPLLLTDTVDPFGDNTLELLSAAAHLVSLHQMAENDHIPSVSDLPDVVEESKSASTDDDDSDEETCRIMMEQRENLFALNKKQQRPERFYIADKNSYCNLKQDIQSSLGPQKSTYFIRRRLEIGCSTKSYPVNSSVGIAYCSKASLRNRFLPNCRKIVAKVPTKTFCCQHINDDQQLAVASQDGIIRFYEKYGDKSRYIQTSAYTLSATSWSVLDVGFASNGSSFSYGTWKDAVVYCRLIEPSSECPEGIFFQHLALPPSDIGAVAVFSLRYSQADHEILCGSSDRGLHVFDLETHTRVVTVDNAHEDDVNAVCYADSSSQLLFSGGDDGIVNVWDRRAFSEGDTRPVGFFAGHKDGITYIDSKLDGRYLISNSKDQTVKLWDLRKFSTEEGAIATRDSVSRQKWDYRWQTAPKMIEKALPGDTSVLTLRGHSVLHTLVRAKFSPENTGSRYVYTGCARGEVVVYDLLSGNVCRRLSGHAAVVRDVSWNSTANEIVSCSWDGVTAVWKYDERKERSLENDPSSQSYLSDPDSCDEFYKPIVNVKKSRCKRRRERSTNDDSVKNMK